MPAWDIKGSYAEWYWNSIDYTVTMLELRQPLKWRAAEGALRIEVPALSIDEVPCRHAYVFKLINVIPR